MLNYICLLRNVRPFLAAFRLALYIYGGCFIIFSATFLLAVKKYGGFDLGLSLLAYKLVTIALWYQRWPYVTLSALRDCRRASWLYIALWYNNVWQYVAVPLIFAGTRNSINWPDMLIRIKLTDVSVGKKSTFATYPNK